MSVDLDAASLIESLSTGSIADGTPYTVTRHAAATFTAGIAVPISPSTITITASVYQATGRDLQRLPEERRSISTMIVFTTTRLYTGAEHGIGSESVNEADQIAIGGLAYELQTVEAWPGAVGFYKCVAQAVG